MMKTHSLSPPSPYQAWSREYLVNLIKVGLSVKKNSFSRLAALSWLSVYPGDLAVQLLYTQSLFREGKIEQAHEKAYHLCQADPEFLAAQKLLTTLEESKPVTVRNRETWGILYALEEKEYPQMALSAKGLLPAWSKKLKKARQAFTRGELELAAQHAHAVMGFELATPLAAITQLVIMAADPTTPPMAIRNLAEHYYKKWPSCLACSLVFADTLIKTNQAEKGVHLLHKIATEDVTGQVARRLWGAEHPYLDLWPTKLQAYLELQIPAEIGAALGWNQLSQGSFTATTQKTAPPLNLPKKPQGATATKKEEGEAPSPSATPPEHIPPETLQSIQKELADVAKKLGRPTLTNRDGRFPIYVIFSAKRGLESKYGPETTKIIQEEARRLAHAVREKPDWGAVVFFADDPSSAAALEVKPAQTRDAWTLKLALADLDTALAKKGMMIGAVLIIGGPEVIPFHRLPNPVDDADTDVPSDNPYATRDENYFIPEWPVGRLPGGAGRDPGLLLSALRGMVDQYSQRESRSWWKTALEWLVGLFFSRDEKETNFGYAAEAWKKASGEVFRPIGNSDNLFTSPPFGEERPLPALKPGLGYFNLHGVIDNSPWYGQRDMTQTSAGEAYPIALRPEDIQNGQSPPAIVFSEACYGAHLEKRAVDDSVALQFLRRGSRIVAGSTVTSYGSVTGSLIAADLLSNYFWRYLREGFSSGEALQKAKISLARKMHKRQGYLDGEDQKTLISFVLYGDPLTTIRTARSEKGSHAKTTGRRQTTPPVVKMVCDKSMVSESLPTDVLKQVRQVVKKYLPGMEGAQLTISEEHGLCAGKGHSCPTSQLGTKSFASPSPQRRVVTMRKSVRVSHNGAKAVHQHYARVTFNGRGKVVKLAVSR